MPKFSKSSDDKLNTCHPLLQTLFREVVKHYDCTIICGHRGEKEQNEAFANGYSKLKFPQSKHNSMPSRAVDVLPHPFTNWNDKLKFVHFAGYVLATADRLGIKIRCGIDFNEDLKFNNDSFFDGPHFELK